jgi:hypothetical protein
VTDQAFGYYLTPAAGCPNQARWGHSSGETLLGESSLEETLLGESSLEETLLGEMLLGESLLGETLGEPTLYPVDIVASKMIFFNVLFVKGKPITL